MGSQAFMQALASGKFPLEFPGHWIDGKWRQDSKSDLVKVSMNPSQDQRLVEVRLGRELVSEALENSCQYEAQVASIPMKTRVEHIQKFAQVLADYREVVIKTMSVEVGKPRWDSEEDLNSALNFLKVAIAAGKDIESLVINRKMVARPGWHFGLQPVGVTLAFLPFSAPLTTFVQSFTCSLLAGCPLLLMSSGNTVLSGILYSALAELMEVPRGTLNCLFGSFKLFRQCLLDKRVKAVLYTGSREHCETIRRESQTFSERQLMLQSGGKNAVIVDATADLKKSLDCVIFGLVKSAGQLNTSTSRVFVHESMLNKFAEAMSERLNSLQIGPTDQDNIPQMGPLYSKKSVEKFLRFQTMAKRMADDTLTWGKACDEAGKGYFVTPGAHIIHKFDATSAYQSNVLMCPDLAIYPFSELDEAIEWTNATDAPFVVSFMGDSQIVQNKKSLFKAPNILVNLPTVGVNAFTPVGGKLQCGHHRFNGLGYINLLTYPQALLDDSEIEEDFYQNQYQQVKEE